MKKWLRLFPVISKSCLFALQEQLIGTNISGSQVPYILCIHQNQGCSQDLLVKTLHLDKGCVAKTIKTLEEKNLVFKKSCENDKRAYQLFLTDDCKKLIKQLNQNRLNVENTLTKNMSQEEIETFIRLLKQAAFNISDGKINEDNKI